MSGPELRRAGPADDAAIRRLLAVAYPANPKADAAVMRWQYWDNPFGPAQAWVWELDGDVIAHWAAVPVPLLLDGRPAPGVKTADAATHPGHRRMGLFATLALRYMEDLRVGGVRAVLTHPNPDSTPGVEGSGAALVERVPVFVRALDSRWLARRFHVPRPLVAPVRAAVFGRVADAPHLVVDGLPEGLDALWSAHAPQWTIRRDAAWWDWRYLRRPGGDYRLFALRRGDRLAAAGVTHVREAFKGRFGYVMEFLAADDAAARELADAMAAQSREEGASGLVAAATSGSRLAAQVAAAGFRRLPRRLEPNPLRFLVADPAGDSVALARHPWAMSWGDLDHL